uniref:Leucine-rich repeat-containing protein 4 n=1 Tax=Ceratitis capitata TaxID=7213 RepID=W8B5T3_CERCA
MARHKRTTQPCNCAQHNPHFDNDRPSGVHTVFRGEQGKCNDCGVSRSSACQITLATKVRRKSRQIPASRQFRSSFQLLLPAFKISLHNLLTIPLAQLLWLLCCLSLAHPTLADCPSMCECKWKSGKESVLCLNANLTHIPVPLDAGTQVLDLTGNDIASIPHDTFAAVNLLNLQKVYLAKCHLRVIERFAFRKLINLVELDLSYNLLSSIPTESFEFITELREIKLNGNPITRVQDDAFGHVPQLVRVELSDCKLTTVEVRAFAGLETTLEWLKLDGNKLSEVRSGTITSLTNLHGIELARNQWNCSCALRPLRAWMLRENIPYGIPPLCRAPARLAGKTWDKIDLDDFACVPQIIATDTTAHGVEGRNVTMSCFVEGVPEPSVRWMVKNRVIANLTSSGDPSASPRTAAATQGRKTYVVNMLRNASNLTILTADMQDAGIYTCAAENKAGKVEASVTLAVSRRPPEAPMGAKIVLLCIFIALLFVVGSSFAAICFCSLRRKRKMRLWNSVPPARTESYEKIEMTSRVCGGGGSGNGPNGSSGGGILGNRKPDLGGGSTGGGADVTGSFCNTNGGGSGVGGVGLFPNDDNDYLHTATTPLNCGSDDGGDAGVAIVNPSGGSAKRNGDYRNIPTHCDDDEDGLDANYQTTKISYAGGKHANQTSVATRWRAGLGAGGSAVVLTGMRASPQDLKRKVTAGSCNGEYEGDAGPQQSDLHIPRLIEIGGSDSASSSISSQVDAAARLGGYNHIPNWTTTPIATTKITSPHSKRAVGQTLGANNNAYYNNNDDVSTSVFCSGEGVENDLFDSNYPDLLDIAKYAVAQATNSNNSAQSVINAAAGSSANAALCTLPRKLKNTGKYFKSSTDSQSPLLADNSSKYGSSTLGDASFLNELTLGRRFSAESSYSNYVGTSTYTSGQRSNSFLNLVQSTNKGNLNMSINGATAMSLSGVRRNPSLPSSPIHDAHQHQRSFSSAATPLLDFSSLTSRTGVTTAPATGVAAAASSSMHPTTNTSTVAAYDYHAAQLERFLEEYRNLQDQLCKMKETCETIRKKEVPMRVSVGHSAQLADPVMFNAALVANTPPAANAKTSTLKTKTLLPGQPPDPPPYWLHRNAMLKRLNETQSDIFKS